MPDDGGLVFAYILDGKGGGEPVHWDGVRSFHRSSGRTLWVHLDYEGAEAQKWLTGESGLDPVVCEALTEKETRPRVHVHNIGVSAILRGVNHDPGADPEDMVSVRVWVEPGLVITMRHPIVLEKLLRRACDQLELKPQYPKFLNPFSSRYSPAIFPTAILSPTIFGTPLISFSSRATIIGMPFSRKR